MKWINNELKLEESGTQPPEQEKLNCFKDNLSLVSMDYNSRYLLFNRNFFNFFTKFNKFLELLYRSNTASVTLKPGSMSSKLETQAYHLPETHDFLESLQPY